MRLVLATCAAALLLTGCLGTYTGDPEARGPRNVQSRSRPDLAKKVPWQKVYLGAGKQAVLLGYVKTTPEETNWIYDEHFRLRGRVSPSGKTTRVMLGGEEQPKGSFTLDLAVLTVFGYTERKTVVFAPMDPPRG
ncbi:MAG: hypothetical protein AB7N76_08990 [Planctomycetota bacterium]